MCRGNESAIRKAPGPRTKAYAPDTPTVNSAAGTGSDAKKSTASIPPETDTPRRKTSAVIYRQYTLFDGRLFTTRDRVVILVALNPFARRKLGLRHTPKGTPKYIITKIRYFPAANESGAPFSEAPPYQSKYRSYSVTRSSHFTIPSITPIEMMQTEKNTVQATQIG